MGDHKPETDRRICKWKEEKQRKRERAREREQKREHTQRISRSELFLSENKNKFYTYTIMYF